MSRSVLRSLPPARWGALAWACALAIQCMPAQADERAELEKIRVTTQSLIQALVDSGLLPREKAEAILKQAAEAGEKAAAAVSEGEARQAQAPVSPAPSQGSTQTATTRKGNLIRIPYLSETTKAELREQVKQEVLAQAHQERWGEPGALPSWLDKVTFYGDVRTMLQYEGYAHDNTAPDDPSFGFAAAPAADLAWGPDVVNTQHDRARLMLRARMGVKADLGSGFGADIRVSTGNGVSPVGVTPTEGNYFNKYAVWFDRAYVSYDDNDKWQVKAGRFAPPFYGGDVIWADDVNVDGLSATFKPAFGAGQSMFMTAGVFPLRELDISAQDQWLYGAQIGAALPIGSSTLFRTGVALYDFQGVEGRQDTQIAPNALNKAIYGYALTEYPYGVRQRGNTLIRLNNPLGVNDGSPSIWGLASRFRPLTLSADMMFMQFFPITVKASFDYIKNLGFNLQDIRDRSGQSDLMLTKQNTAVQAKLVVGAEKVEKPGQWQTYLAFRRLERDAWIDAFADPNWNLGGTNYQGWSLGGQYGIGPSTSLGLRYYSTRNISDPIVYSPSLSNNATLKIDVLQFELTARF